MEEYTEMKLRIERRPPGQATLALSSLTSAAPSSTSGGPEESERMLAVARRLIAEEQLTESTVADTPGPAAFRACEKLRQPLSTVFGAAGFRSLFLRALTLAKAEVPWLGGLQIATDGDFEFSPEMKTQLDGEEALRGGTALIAQLLGLLVTFIGEALTLRLVLNVWPKATATDSKPPEK